jgi:hypothetical protein
MIEFRDTTWRSDVAVQATPRHVLDALTDVDSCKAWSPVGFHVEDFDSTRLRAGTRLHVTGSLVGQRVRFAVEIVEASSRRLALRALGPIEMAADYVVRAQGCSSRIDAAISIRPARGLRGALLGRAIAIMLAAGALKHTLVRLAREAERRASSQPRDESRSRPSSRSRNHRSHPTNRSACARPSHATKGTTP